MIWLVGGFGYVGRSRGGCRWVWASLSTYVQGTKVGRSGWVRLIGQGSEIWLVGGCGYECRSRGGCGLVWARMGKGEQVVSRFGWVRLIGWGWVIWLVGGCGYAYRSRGGCGWASLGIYGQGWAKVGRSRWVRLIEHRSVI